jgi:hypothetical protein
MNNHGDRLLKFNKKNGSKYYFKENKKPGKIRA